MERMRGGAGRKAREILRLRVPTCLRREEKASGRSAQDDGQAGAAKRCEWAWRCQRTVPGIACDALRRKATATRKKDRYFSGGAGSSGMRLGSPWKPRISMSSSRSDGEVIVAGMPPLAEP